MKRKYVILDDVSYEPIEEADSFEEAMQIVEEYEKEDAEDDIDEGSYLIVDPDGEVVWGKNMYNVITF